MKHPEGEIIYYIRSYLLQQTPLLSHRRGKTLEVLLSLFDVGDRVRDRHFTAYPRPCSESVAKERSVPKFTVSPWHILSLKHSSFFFLFL